jgi:Flp pilus assembly protein TadG
MKSWHHLLALRCHEAVPGDKRQRGAIAVIFAAVLMFIIGMFALALDLSMVYNRKAEMHNAATTLALAAAKELNGTAAGITGAVAQAELRLTEPNQRLLYQYSTKSVEWSAAAIQFSSNADGGWQQADTAKANPGNIVFVKVDTKELGDVYSKVKTLFLHVLEPKSSIVRVSSSAVAGRTSINAVPLAICALGTDPRSTDGGELVEFGFRRGVSYDLMKLNSAPAPVAFLINPFAPPGTAAALPIATSDLSVVKPFVCSGTMAMTRVTGGDLTVTPLTTTPPTELFDQLNSRFDSYTALKPCDKHTAPPDTNVKEYVYTDSNLWMKVAPTRQTAKLSPSGSKDGVAANLLGPLWSYAPSVKYSASVPANGEIPFSTDDWALIYNGADVKGSNISAKSLPYSLPYSLWKKSPPSGKVGVLDRRVLNVPLLSCPVTGNRATALGIGRFFMTVKAGGTALSLNAEFAGMTPEASLGGRVELFK